VTDDLGVADEHFGLAGDGAGIRERVRLAGEIAAATAEGRMSAVILGGMPFAMAFLINIVRRPVSVRCRQRPRTRLGPASE
jgi:hypothetical protein